MQHQITHMQSDMNTNNEQCSSFFTDKVDIMNRGQGHTNAMEGTVSDCHYMMLVTLTQVKMRGKSSYASYSGQGSLCNLILELAAAEALGIFIVC